MLQPGGQADLAEKPLRAERRGELRTEDLEGDETVVLAVAREIHGGHPALAKLPLDQVALAKGGLELRNGGHGFKV